MGGTCDEHSKSIVVDCILSLDALVCGGLSSSPGNVSATRNKHGGNEVRDYSTAADLRQSIGRQR